jgi:hypothetical protein
MLPIYRAMLRQLTGLFATGLGIMLCADFRGSATALRNRRWVLIREPAWFWRAWGAFMAMGGLMIVIQ